MGRAVPRAISRALAMAGSPIGKRVAAWRDLSPRHKSYVVYGVVATLVSVGLMVGASQLDVTRCLESAIDSDAGVTVANLHSDVCADQPFTSIVDVADDRPFPSYDERLGISATSARSWTLIYSALLSATVASGVAGAGMAIVTSRPDASRSGWRWGIFFAVVALVVVSLLTRTAGDQVLRAAFDTRADRPTIVNYSKLGYPYASVAQLATLISGGAMMAAIVAVGHTLHCKTGRRAGLAFAAEIEEVRRAAVTIALVLSALTGTLSLGVLATGAQLRLIEHLPGVGDLPGLLSVIYGILLTLVTASLYVPTQARLDAARQSILDRTAGTGLGGKTLRRRNHVRAELDLEIPIGGAARRVATALGPLIVAAVSSVLA